MAIDPAVLAAFKSPTPPQPVSVLLVAVPPGTPPRVQGDVVQVDQASGQVTIKIPQGTITIQTDAVALQIGQKVDIRLPAAPQAGAQASIIPYPASAQQNAPLLQTPLPPAVTVEVAQNPSAPLPTPSPSSYQASTINTAPTQTIAQLVGQNLPATVVVPPSGTQNAASPFTITPPVVTPLSVLAGVAPRVQILFIGSVEEATQILSQSVSTLNTDRVSPAAQIPTQASSLTTPFLPVTTGTTQNVQTTQTIPILAQLIGVTPQKLPIFETVSQPSVIAGNIGSSTLQSSPIISGKIIAEGTQIIVHAPVNITAQKSERVNVSVAALLVQLPPTSATPAQSFALDSLPQLAPLFTQLLQDPASVLPAALAAQMGATIPRPGTPRFAMNMAMALLGLSTGDPAQILPRAVLDALKPNQRGQLQKELQTIAGLSRDAGAQNTEGARFNIPVEMGGQLYLWQMTLRHHDGQNNGAGGDTGVEYPTRFILDLYMSHMGPIQVDGLSFSKSRRLDLVLRTQTILGDSVQKMLRDESLAVFERARLTGSIDFQSL